MTASLAERRRSCRVGDARRAPAAASCHARAASSRRRELPRLPLVCHAARSAPHPSSVGMRNRTALTLAALATVFVVLLAAGYRLYGGWVARQLRLEPERTTPARAHEDGRCSTPPRRWR